MASPLRTATPEKVTKEVITRTRTSSWLTEKLVSNSTGSLFRKSRRLGSDPLISSARRVI